MAPGSEPALGSSLDPAAYAIGGRSPARAVRPESRDELAECLRGATRDRLAVVPWGGGTSLGRVAAPPRYDLAVDLRGLDRIIEYDPEDLTITAECGITLGGLRRTLGERGQELPIEGARPEAATLGGALASNSSGPRRLAFGSPRDRILGASMALADGTPVRTGGRVVKNVAGYAIHRLLCGSRGALGVIVEASLKLLPAPAARRALILDVPTEALDTAARWAFLPVFEPAAVTVVGPGAAARAPLLPVPEGLLVVVVLEGNAARVQQEAETIVTRLGEPVRVLESADVVRVEQALCDAGEPSLPRLELVTPWNSPAALGVLRGTSAVHDIVFHAPAGRLHLVPSSEDPAPIVRRLAGASFLLVAADGIHDLAVPAAPLTAVTDLRRRVRSALDPSDTWAFGPAW
jgi:glycolate oxidase FAD binding subunit